MLFAATTLTGSRGWRRPHLGERPLHAVPSDDDAIPLVCAPALKQLSGQTALHHTGGCHHHAGADVVEMVHALGRKMFTGVRRLMEREEEARTCDGPEAPDSPSGC